MSQIIVKRIGLEEFLDKLGSVSRHEQYSQAAKHPQVRPRQPQDLLLDHEFCRLLKALEGLVSKSVSPSDVMIFYYPLYTYLRSIKEKCCDRGNNRYRFFHGKTPIIGP